MIRRFDPLPLARLSVLGACVASAIAWFGLGIDASAFLARLPDLCVFHRLTGLWCPGCGMTRAILSLGRFDFGTALAFHPLSPLVLLACVPGSERWRMNAVLSVPVLVWILAFGVLRNL